MQCKDIMAMIEGTYPKSAALGFDNVGLQAGKKCKKKSSDLSGAGYNRCGH